MTKPKRLKPNKLIVAIMLTCIIIIAAATVTGALANLEAGYANPKVTLAIPTAFKGLSNNTSGNQIILITSNLTTSKMTDQIYSLQNPSALTISTPNQEMENAPGFYQIHRNTRQPDTMTPSYMVHQPQPTFIFAFTNKTGSFLIVKD